MKKIILIETKVTNTQVPDFKLNYKIEFLQACEIAEQGMTISEMSLAIKIGDKLRKAEIGDYLLLEDAEHEWLSNQMQRRRFSIVAIEIVEMIESLANASKVGVRPVEANSVSVQPA